MSNWKLHAEHIVEMRDPTLDKVIFQDSVSPDTITYFCFAPIGTSQSAYGWRIYRIKSISLVSPTKDVWGFPRLDANSDYTSEYIYQCSNAGGYSYSQNA